MLQGQTDSNVSFMSLKDADNAVNALVSPCNNTANAQTIYVREESYRRVLQLSHGFEN